MARDDAPTGDVTASAVAEPDARLRADATWIERQSGIRTVALRLSSSDPADLAAQLHGLRHEIGAVFLTGHEPERVRQAQRVLIGLGGRPVITSEDGAAIALTAALLTYLRRLRRPLAGVRVMIAGAASLPVLCPLLLTAGILKISLWNRVDSPQLPLSRAARDTDAVINLLGPAHDIDRVRLDRPIGSVIGLNDGDQLLALPGLFRAIAASPGPLIDIEAYYRCARGVMNATPPRRLTLLPSPHSRDLTREVAAAAWRVVREDRGSTSRQSSSHREPD